MGRGGGRAKASGGSMSQESPLINTRLTLNMTLFQFLQTGYFEKDLLSYCANRLAEYSCVFWLDPSVDDDSDTVDLHTAAVAVEPSTLTTEPGTELTRYPSHFINQKDTPQPSGVTLVRTLSEGDPITGTFLGPINVRKSFTSEAGSTLAIVENSRLPVDAIARVILPFLLIIACSANLFLLRSGYRLARKRLPIAIYLVYISIIDQVDLLARGTDYLVQAYGGIRLFTAVQFLGRSACQLLPMTHSALRHIHASLLVGLTIDTCRMANEPHRFSRKFRSEWAQNVLILAAILAIALDCQYLWTFDLSQIETKVLHERVVHNAYECGFSQTSILSPLFLYYIWPMIDHLWGEILPCGVCLFTGLATLMHRHLKTVKLTKIKTSDILGPSESLSKHVPNGPAAMKDVLPQEFNTGVIQESVYAFTLISIVNGLFILPRMAYYLTKYGLFSMNYMNRAGGPYWSNYEVQPEHPTLQLMMETLQRVSQLRQYEAPLEGIEAVLCYLGAINILCNAIILSCKLTPVRQDLLIQWASVLNLLSCKSKRCRIVPSREVKQCVETQIMATHETPPMKSDVEFRVQNAAETGRKYAKTHKQTATFHSESGRCTEAIEQRTYRSTKGGVSSIKAVEKRDIKQLATKSHRIYSL